MFGDYVSPALVDRVVASGKNPPTGPAEVEITPFFASVHSYVSLAEQMSLTQLRELLNTYFDACVTEIHGERGTVDKFIGDAIVAMFGAPLQTPDHALHGCVAALKCQARVAELRERLRREENKWPERARQLRVRIGLHTGVALVGNMGTKARLNYTMMGDNVNLAARMESGAKSYGVWTLCTDATQGACERTDPGRVIFRSLGRIVVNGRAKQLEIFEPMALRENVTDQLRECVEVFESGLACFRAHDWDGAIVHFEKSARIERDQPGAYAETPLNPSTLYLKMARSSRAEL
jgi:adenylate cyclase